MRSVVVDTNVAVAANGESDASLACAVACQRRLYDITKRGRIAIDSKWRILREYQSNLRSSGQPGVGDGFLKWILTNLANTHRCEQVSIVAREGAVEDYEEFPRDPELAKFDPSDRKFVAVAVAPGGPRSLLEATDSDLWNARNALQRCGVDIEFLCPDDIGRQRRGT